MKSDTQKIKEIKSILDDMFKTPNSKVDAPIDQIGHYLYNEGHGHFIQIRSVFLDLQHIVNRK